MSEIPPEWDYREDGSMNESGNDWDYCRRWLTDFTTSFGGTGGGCQACWRTPTGDHTYRSAASIGELKYICLQAAQESEQGLHRVLQIDPAEHKRIEKQFATREKAATERLAEENWRALQRMMGGMSNLCDTEAAAESARQRHLANVRRIQDEMDALENTGMVAMPENIRQQLYRNSLPSTPIDPAVFEEMNRQLAEQKAYRDSIMAAQAAAAEREMAERLARLEAKQRAEAEARRPGAPKPTVVTPHSFKRRFG